MSAFDNKGLIIKGVYTINCYIIAASANHYSPSANSSANLFANYDRFSLGQGMSGVL
jgi:hypothetical protein